MAEAVKMYVEKFGGEVLIEENHPLAVAQRAKDAKASSRKPAKPDAGSDDADDSTSPNLARMNLAQLTAHAEERGVVIPEGSSKKEIITLLEALE